MDSYLLRQFVAVARHEHIGRAAEQLHMSASPLSRRIRKLEAELGITLFHRDGRGICLTKPGSVLLEDATRLLAMEDRISARALAAANGVDCRVILGFVEGALRSGVLTSALTATTRRHPTVVVDLRNLRTDAQIDQLLDNELDVAVTHRNPQQSTLRSALIHKEPLRLAVASNASLSSSDLTMRILADQRWIVISSHSSPTGHAGFIHLCEVAGLTPDVICEVADPSSALELVAAGIGIAVIQASASHPKVRLLEIPEDMFDPIEIWASMATSAEPIAQELWSNLTEQQVGRTSRPTLQTRRSTRQGS